MLKFERLLRVENSLLSNHPKRRLFMRGRITVDAREKE
jgi:hypothetical protein